MDENAVADSPRKGKVGFRLHHQELTTFRRDNRRHFRHHSHYFRRRRSPIFLTKLGRECNPVGKGRIFNNGFIETSIKEIKCT